MFSQVQPDLWQTESCNPPPTLSTLSQAGLMPHSSGQPEGHLNIMEGRGRLRGRVTSVLSALLVLYQHLLS